MKKHEEEIIAWIKKKRFGNSHHRGMVGKIDIAFWDSQIDFFD